MSGSDVIVLAFIAVGLLITLRAASRKSAEQKRSEAQSRAKHWGQSGNLMAAGLFVMVIGLLAGVRGPWFWFVTCLSVSLVAAGTLALVARSLRR